MHSEIPKCKDTNTCDFYKVKSFVSFCCTRWVATLLILAVSTLATDAFAELRDAPFSLSVGTQNIGPKYQFSDEPLLVESAKVMQKMGSDTLKISVSPRYHKRYKIKQDSAIDSLTKIVRDVPDYRTVFDMPFRNVMFWAYPFAEEYSAFRKGKLPKAEAEAIYAELYELTAYLLTEYSGSGKSFFIGNWEGDWHLLSSKDIKTDPKEAVIAASIQWFKVREKAIADARRDTSHADVEVYFYVELNHVRKAIEDGRPALVNRVLPHIKTDFVSWSSYDITQRAVKLGGAEGRNMVHDALNYIEDQLPPSDIPGKRVFLGEYGFKQEWVKEPVLQARYTADIMKWSMEWGCPFILYWQLYCNEIREDTGKHRGFWLIDEHGEKLPSWHLHHDFLSEAKQYVDEYMALHGKLPEQAEYNQEAVKWIEAIQANASYLSNTQD